MLEIFVTQVYILSFLRIVKYSGYAVTLRGFSLD